MRITARRRSGYAHEVTDGTHTIISDEPQESGGSDLGPSPTKLLAMSLAACTAITVEMYADRKEIPVDHIEVEVEYRLDPSAGNARYSVVLKLPPGLDEEQVTRLLVIAGKCPVHRTLEGSVEITDRIQVLNPG